LPEGLGVDVDVDGPRQRSVGAVVDGLLRRRHRLAGLGVDDGHGPQRILVGHVVGIAEVPESVDVAGNALDQHVVVFAGGVVAAAGALFTVDHVGEVVEGTRVGTGTVEVDGRVGPLGPHLAPAGDDALGSRLPNLAEFVDGEGVDPIVFGVDQYREAVEGHRQFDVLDAVGGTGLVFRRLDGPGRVPDDGLPGAELLE